MTSLNSLIRSDRTLIVPGVHDAITARLTEDVGFAAAAVGGSAIASMHAGLPDVGLLNFGEYLGALEQIIAATDLPVLVDGENGFGDVKAVTRVVRQLERVGAASIALEDLRFPPTYGVPPSVVPLSEITVKLEAALEARNDEQLWIIGRTDAAGVLGLDEAILRAQRYAEIGVDAVMLTGVTTLEDLARVRDAVPSKLVALVIEDGPWVAGTPEELSQLGVEVAIYPATLPVAAVTAYREALTGIRDGRVSLPQTSAGHGSLQAALRTEAWGIIDTRARERATDWNERSPNA